MAKDMINSRFTKRRSGAKLVAMSAPNATAIQASKPTEGSQAGQMYRSRTELQTW